MRANLAASALVIVPLLGATGVRAQQAAHSSVGAAVSDTGTGDLRGVDHTAASRHGWIPSPSFFELRLVAAHHSSVPTRMHSAAYRDLYIVDVRAGWTITSSSVLALEYTPSVVPLAVSTRNPEAYVSRAQTVCESGNVCAAAIALDVRTVPRYENTYGFGVTPVGFQLRFFPHWPVQFLAQANGGALWFTKPIPDPNATHFNFTAELGGAVQANLSRGLGLVLGYSWHHTSNGGIGRVNPGVNSRAFTFGLVARR